ncbi:MAG: hypothetical protein KIS92_04890 [Planctomycetota bacterium]|nr:hypothetical protein [Planctomycetota bacterium]
MRNPNGLHESEALGEQEVVGSNPAAPTKQSSRHRFQIHLITAVLLMLVASVLLYLNTQRRMLPYETAYPGLDALISGYGFPRLFLGESLVDLAFSRK